MPVVLQEEPVAGAAAEEPEDEIPSTIWEIFESVSESSVFAKSRLDNTRNLLRRDVINHAAHSVTGMSHVMTRMSIVPSDCAAAPLGSIDGA